jgi:hypothetical protein
MFEKFQYQDSSFGLQARNVTGKKLITNNRSATLI